MNFKVKKRDDKKVWRTFGNVKKNKWGSLELGLKITPELKALLESSSDGWINFSLFEDEKEETQEKSPELEKLLGNDEIPF